MVQQDNAPKHASILVSDGIKQANITLLEQLHQTPDLNPIKTGWSMLKSQSHARKLINLNKLYQFCQEEGVEYPVRTMPSYYSSLQKDQDATC